METKSIIYGNKYKIGKLYIGYVDNEIEFYNPTEEELKNKKFIYDSATGNAHLFPKEVELAEKCADEIMDKRCKVLDVLKDFNETGLVVRRGVGSCGRVKITDGTKYENCKGLFSYIRVACGNRNYDLIFNRFARTRNGNGNTDELNCILKCLQYEVSTSVKSDDIYPDSLEDEKGYEINSINRYYNPSVKFDDNAEKIAEDFIGFIKKCENME